MSLWDDYVAAKRAASVAEQEGLTPDLRKLVPPGMLPQRPPPQTDPSTETLTQKPEQWQEGALEWKLAQEADKRATGGGGRMLPGGWMPHSRSQSVEGATPPSPLELRLRGDSANANMQALQATLEGRKAARNVTGQVAGQVAKVQSQGMKEEAYRSEETEQNLGRMREKVQGMWKDAEYEVGHGFGSRLVMALIAVFGGDAGANIVSSLIDADIAEAEGKAKAGAERAMAGERDIEGFRGMTAEAKERRSEMRAQRLMAALKIGEAHLARLPDDEGKAYGYQQLAEIKSKLADELAEMTKRATGKVTAAGSDQFVPPKLVGGGAAKGYGPGKNVKALLGEVDEAGKDFNYAGGDASLGNKEAALKEVLAIVNEGVSPADQVTLTMVMSDPNALTRAAASLKGMAGGMPPALRARAASAVMQSSRMLNGAKATDKDMERAMQGADFSAGVEAFKGAINTYNAQVNNWAAQKGRGAQAFLAKRRQLEETYAPQIQPGEHKKTEKATKDPSGSKKKSGPPESESKNYGKRE